MFACMCMYAHLCSVDISLYLEHFKISKLDWNHDEYLGNYIQVSVSQISIS